MKITEQEFRTFQEIVRQSNSWHQIVQNKSNKMQRKTIVELMQHYPKYHMLYGFADFGLSMELTELELYLSVGRWNVSMIPFGHRSYGNLNEHPDWSNISPSAFSFEQDCASFERANPKFYCKPIYLFRHGIERLEFVRSCRWDSGPLGLLVVRRGRGGRNKFYEEALENGLNLINDYYSCDEE